jgi:hypothetical protein
MNARLLARGFVNSLTERSNNVFAEVAAQHGKEYRTYRVVLDKDFAYSLKKTAPLDEFTKGFAKQPVMLCILNPSAEIEEGRIVFGGVLAAWVAYSSYTSGFYDKELFREG